MMQRLLKHPVRHMVQNQLLSIPGAKWIQERRFKSTGANQTENPEAVMIEWAQKVQSNAEAHGLTISKARLAEIGPGHSLGVAVTLLLEGAEEVSALDVRPFCDLADIDQFEAVFKAWQLQGQRKANLSDLRAAVSKLKYAIVTADGGWPVSSSETDLVYSFFAGEHLRNPEAVLLETARILREGGYCMYAIDLRNHLDHKGNWLEHLYHTDGQWSAMTSNRGHWTNRLLAPEWRTLFEKHFEVLAFETRSMDPPPAFSRSRLAKRFQQFSLEDLLIDYVWVIGRKRS